MFISADRAGRLLRHEVIPGPFGEDPRHMSIGSVAQHIEGTVPSNLAWDTANRLTLKELEENVFAAELFFEPSSVRVY